MSDAIKPPRADGKFILVQENQRLDAGPFTTKAEASAEASKLQPVQESKGQKAPIEVKQILES